MVFNTLNKTFSLQTLCARLSLVSLLPAHPQSCRRPVPALPPLGQRSDLFSLRVRSTCWSQHAALHRARLRSAKGSLLTSLQVADLFKKVVFRIGVLSNETSQQLADFKSETGEVSESVRPPRIAVGTMRGLCLQVTTARVTLGFTFCFH